MLPETKAVYDAVTASEGKHNNYSAEKYAGFVQATLNDDDVKFQSCKVRSGEIVEKGEINPRKNVVSVIKSVARRATGMSDADASFIDSVVFTKKEASQLSSAMAATVVDYTKKGNRYKFPIQEDYALEIETSKVKGNKVKKTVSTIPSSEGEERKPLRDVEVSTKDHYVGKVRKATPSWLKSVKVLKEYK